MWSKGYLVSGVGVNEETVINFSETYGGWI